jgi:hypothetical protein
MAINRSRGETVGQGETVQLRALFRGPDGNETDLDAFPTITITQPSGNIIIGPTNIGVYRLSVGVYGFDYDVKVNDSLGVWTDIWDGVLDTLRVSGSFNFVVQNTQMPAINTDGYEHLGDDVGFNYSQTSIHNINLLMKTLRARLDSMGKVKTKDEYGNEIYAECDIFSIATMVSFIVNSLSLFNGIPHFTLFTFEDTDFIQQFHDVLVQGAAIMALSSKALIEKGSEFSLTDQGVDYKPPSVADLMQTEWSTELTNHTDKVKLIKQNMKPAPLGLGTLTISTSRHPAIARLRHLRERQII